MNTDEYIESECMKPCVGRTKLYLKWIKSSGGVIKCMTVKHSLTSFDI